MKVLAGVVAAALVVALVALVVAATTSENGCNAASNGFAFFVSIGAVLVAIVCGLVAVVQVFRRRRARPHVWWYLASAFGAAATLFVGTAALATSMSRCFD